MEHAVPDVLKIEDIADEQLVDALQSILAGSNNAVLAHALSHTILTKIGLENPGLKKC